MHLTAGVDSYKSLNNAAILLGTRLGQPPLLGEHLWRHVREVENGLMSHCSNPIGHGDPACLSMTALRIGSVRKEALVKAFMSLLKEDELPQTARAAAALCTGWEGNGPIESRIYVVAMLCETGRVMHVWQTMLETFADRSTLPTNAEWRAALDEASGMDPRGESWHRQTEGSGRRSELIAYLWRDFFASEEDMAEILPTLQKRAGGAATSGRKAKNSTGTAQPQPSMAPKRKKRTRVRSVKNEE